MERVDEVHVSTLCDEAEEEHIIRKNFTRINFLIKMEGPIKSDNPRRYNMFACQISSPESEKN
jgi:hypothetical protein